MMARTGPERLGLVVVLAATMSVRASSAELKPATVAAFDRYIRATEARIAGELQDEHRFLSTGDPGEEARARLAELAAGRLVIERLDTLEDGKPIEVPDGLIHHWLGVVFVPAGRRTGGSRPAPQLRPPRRDLPAGGRAIARARAEWGQLPRIPALLHEKGDRASL